jgi:putative transposase
LPTEDEKRRERSHAVGLFRYQLICPALDGGLSTKVRGRLVREIAAREHTDPFGARVRYSRDTLDRWIRRYRAGGFEELIPSPRASAPRTDVATLELAASLKRENPARTAAQVQRILRAAAGWSPSESTLLRHFHRCELIGPAAGDTPAVFGRFEAENPNDRWTGDALHGPKIGGRKTYLFAFLDDHSRLVCGYRFGFSEDTVRLGVALEPALACRGVPASVYVDNGSAFVDAWLLRACAKLGIRLVHSTPHRPQGRGKIERFFRTVREQFLVEITDTTAEDLVAAGTDHRTALLALNGSLTAWIETEYHRRTHTETGQSPLDRWDGGWTRLGRTPAMPTADDLTEAFLWSEYRMVTKTATVSLHGILLTTKPSRLGMFSIRSCSFSGYAVDEMTHVVGGEAQVVDQVADSEARVGVATADHECGEQIGDVGSAAKEFVDLAEQFGEVNEGTEGVGDGDGFVGWFEVIGLGQHRFAIWASVVAVRPATSLKVGMPSWMVAARRAI